MEMILIMLALLLVFGAKRLPELGSGLGKGIREFKRSINDIKAEVEAPMKEQQIRPPVAPQQPPVQETAAPESQESFNKQ
jgi:sec-independent protein translocase protein TatA